MKRNIIVPSILGLGISIPMTFYYPVSFVLLSMAILTSIIICQVKFQNDATKYVLFSYLSSGICIAIFFVLLFLSTRIGFIREILLYQLLE